MPCDRPLPPPRCLAKRDLSPAFRRLLELFQRIRFGRIPALTVRDGQPDLADGVAWVRTVKVTGENAPHPAREQADFLLRHEVVQFVRLVNELGDGRIENLEIRHGLPFSFEVQERLGR